MPPDEREGLDTLSECVDVHASKGPKQCFCAFNKVASHDLRTLMCHARCRQSFKPTKSNVWRSQLGTQLLHKRSV